MKISSKSRCAILFMVDLAKYNTGQPISVKDVAKRRNISEKFLEQSVSSLSASGLISSIRGPRGGYVLNGNPSEITVGMILRRIESNMFVSEVYTLEKNDVTIKLCNQLDSAVDNVVDGISLKDLVEWDNNMVLDYVI